MVKTKGKFSNFRFEEATHYCKVFGQYFDKHAKGCQFGECKTCQRKAKV